MDFGSSLAIPAMSFFFFCSAYLFFRKFTLFDYYTRIIKRSRSILLPYVFWNSIFAIYFIVKSLFETKQIYYNNITFFIRDTYLFFDGIGCSDGPLWYLFRIMGYMIISPIIYLLLKNKKVGVITILLLFAMNFYDLSYFKFFYWLPVFCIGAYIAIHHFEAFEKNVRNQMSILIICIFHLLFTS